MHNLIKESSQFIVILLPTRDLFSFLLEFSCFLFINIEKQIYLTEIVVLSYLLPCLHFYLNKCNKFDKIIPKHLLVS